MPCFKKLAGWVRLVMVNRSQGHLFIFRGDLKEKSEGLFSGNRARETTHTPPLGPSAGSWRKINTKVHPRPAEHTPQQCGGEYECFNWFLTPNNSQTFFFWFYEILQAEFTSTPTARWMWLHRHRSTTKQSSGRLWFDDPFAHTHTHIQVTQHTGLLHEYKYGVNAGEGDEENKWRRLQWGASNYSGDISFSLKQHIKSATVMVAGSSFNKWPSKGGHMRGFSTFE